MLGDGLAFMFVLFCLWVGVGRSYGEFLLSFIFLAILALAFAALCWIIIALDNTIGVLTIPALLVVCFVFNDIKKNVG